MDETNTADTFPPGKIIIEQTLQHTNVKVKNMPEKKEQSKTMHYNNLNSPKMSGTDLIGYFSGMLDDR